MARGQRTDAYAHSWADLWEAIDGWEDTFGVRVELRIRRTRHLSSPAVLEVRLHDSYDLLNDPRAIETVKEPLPRGGGCGAPGVMLWAVSRAITNLDNEPWNWTVKMRKERVKKE